MGYEDLKAELGPVGGRLVAVETPLALLSRIGFFETAREAERMLFFRSPRAIRRAVREIAKMHLGDTTVLMGDLGGLPLARRSVDLVVCPFPALGDPHLLRSLRRTAGVLVHGGVLMVHGAVRRNVLGWGLHLASVLARRRGGLPSEWDVTAWVLRSGFNRIVRVERGRGLPHTILHARKNLL